MAALSSAVNPLTLHSPSGGLTRINEKESMQELNTRLSMYITHVRQIRESAHKVDSSAFLESTKILEDELVHLKDSYEAELAKTRAQAEELKQAKNQLLMETNKMKSLASDLENRLQVETGRHQQATSEISMLQRDLLQKEQDVKNAQLAIKTPMAEVERLQTLYDALYRENQDLKRKYEKEQLQRQEHQDRAHEAQEKLAFQINLHDGQLKEMNSRLQASAATILELEAKVRDYAIADSSLQEVLQRVRETAEASLRQYQEESAAAFNQSLSELQSQLSTANAKLQEVTDENERLHEDAGNHLAKCRQLEGQINSLSCQKEALEDLLNHERIRARDNVECLERKLRSLQDLLVSKMREVNAARDAQIPLKAEIEAFRSMLEEEERRLRLPPAYHSDAAPGAPYSAFNQSQISMTTAANNLNTTKTGMSSLINTSTLPVPPSGSVGLIQQPLGPVRVRSAPAPNKQHQVNLVSTSLGRGKDYFDGLFNDLKVRGESPKVSCQSTKHMTTSSSGPLAHIQPLPSPPQPLPEFPLRRSQTMPLSPPGGPDAANKCSGSPVADKSAVEVSGMLETHDYTTGTSSSTGNFKILEVHPEGKYIRLLNSSDTDEEIGGYLIQQNVGGHPVAAFRFPGRINFPANNTVTVWSGSNDPMLHQPPSDFVFKEQQKWGTGPECTTILCKANGQAVAWTTAAHRFSRDAFAEQTSPPNSAADDDGRDEAAVTQLTMGEPLQEGDALPEYNMDINAAKPDAVYLKREKENPPCLNPPKHPHGVQPPADVHPHTGQARPLTYGNDNSSVNRQSRGQSTRPDPIAGAPYAGASAQRMGSAMLRRSPTASGAIANRSGEDSRGAATSRPPSSFQKPHARFNTGLTQVQSQHNMDFQPPMPRPPLFSTW